MSYSVISTGRGKVANALSISDRLASSEAQRNRVNEQIERQQDAQTTQAIGSTAGVIAEEMLTSSQAPAAIGEATPVVNNTAAGLAEQGAMEGTTNAMNTSVQQGLQTAIDQQVGQQAGQQLAGQAIGEGVVSAGAEQLAAEGAKTAITDAVVQEGVKTAAIEGGAAVAGELGSAAATTAGLGPAGWALSIGLLGASLL